MREGRTEEALEFAQEYLAPRGEEHPALLGELGARPARPSGPARLRRLAVQGVRSARGRARAGCALLETVRQSPDCMRLLLCLALSDRERRRSDVGLMSAAERAAKDRRHKCAGGGVRLCLMTLSFGVAAGP